MRQVGEGSGRASASDMRSDTDSAIGGVGSYA
jgi:hypothetical protein